ncbi:histone-lysine N-methyltransferase SMYD3 [Trichonephila clavipes]|nr:histone-lysine N-methyltransferase SMYD3 [Trichonephila clavipes]
MSVNLNVNKLANKSFSYNVYVYFRYYVGDKLGELILVSKPYAYVLNNDCRGQRCDYCFQKQSNLKRCSQCSFLYFCDKTCQRELQPIGTAHSDASASECATAPDAQQVNNHRHQHQNAAVDRGPQQSDFQSSCHSTGFVDINYPPCGRTHVTIMTHKWSDLESKIYARADRYPYSRLYTNKSNRSSAGSINVKLLMGTHSLQ